MTPHKRALSALSLISILLGLGLLVVAQFLNLAQAQQDQGKIARILEINGPIGPPIADYITESIAGAQRDGVDLIIIEMDTPGGLDTSMRRIIKEIIASSIPVASYVSPSGARAASAGTYILYASHIAAMAPGTNLGAATPVQLGGRNPLPGSDGFPSADPPSNDDADKNADDDNEADAEPDDGDTKDAMSNEDSMRAKVINDATAYIKGLAELRGRNEDWAVKAVREAASLTASEAADMNVIDFVAGNLNDLLDQANGRIVEVNGNDVTIDIDGAFLEREGPDWATRFLAAITDPNVAFLLMTIGFYGLFFEMANPGAIIPGTFGLIALIMGLYALSVLPVSMAGAGLLLLGLMLMVAEAFAPSFGALGIGGLAAFGLGATMLFDTDAPGFTLSWSIIIGTTLVTGAFMAGIVVFALSAQRRVVTTGIPYMLRQTAIVESWDGDKGWVLFEGERWWAVSNQELKAGQTVKILAVDHLTLEVEPADL